MSEYQRYEFMTVDRPLTRAQLDQVNTLSSHIEASSTHALIEYNWGDFKHDPIKVLYKFFDGFLYWANWGSPQLALRFPHGILPADLLNGYDLHDYATFTQQTDYDILDIQFGEMESPDEWTDYDLGSLIGIRDELMEGDLRALYIVWLASQPQHIIDSERRYYEDDDEPDYEDEFETEAEDEDDDEDENEVGEDENQGENEDKIVPAVPTGFGTLTAAQQALTELLQISQAQLTAAAQYSKATSPANDDFATWIKLLPTDHGTDFLLRLAHNEPGLSRLFVKELRELGQDKTSTRPAEGEHIPYARLSAEGKAIQARLEREEQARKWAERQQQLQHIHTHLEAFWYQVEQGALSGNSSGYDKALHGLIDLREAADHFQTSQEFQRRFLTWVQPHQRRPALLRRLRENTFIR